MESADKQQNSYKGKNFDPNYKKRRTEEGKTRNPPEQRSDRTPRSDTTDRTPSTTPGNERESREQRNERYSKNPRIHRDDRVQREKIHRHEPRDSRGVRTNEEGRRTTNTDSSRETDNKNDKGVNSQTDEREEHAPSIPEKMCKLLPSELFQKEKEREEQERQRQCKPFVETCSTDIDLLSPRTTSCWRNNVSVCPRPEMTDVLKELECARRDPYNIDNIKTLDRIISRLGPLHPGTVYNSRNARNLNEERIKLAISNQTILSSYTGYSNNVNKEKWVRMVKQITDECICEKCGNNSVSLYELTQNKAITQFWNMESHRVISRQTMPFPLVYRFLTNYSVVEMIIENPAGRNITIRAAKTGLGVDQAKFLDFIQVMVLYEMYNSEPRMKPSTRGYSTPSDAIKWRHFGNALPRNNPVQRKEDLNRISFVLYGVPFTFEVLYMLVVSPETDMKIAHPNMTESEYMRYLDVDLATWRQGSTFLEVILQNFYDYICIDKTRIQPNALIKHSGGIITAGTLVQWQMRSQQISTGIVTKGQRYGELDSLVTVFSFATKTFEQHWTRDLFTVTQTMNYENYVIGDFRLYPMGMITPG